jgi:hypothetical protein
MIVAQYFYRRLSSLTPHSLCRRFVWYILLLYFQQVEGKSQSPLEPLYLPTLHCPATFSKSCLTPFVGGSFHPSLAFSTNPNRSAAFPLLIHHDDEIHHGGKCL